MKSRHNMVTRRIMVVKYEVDVLTVNGKVTMTGELLETLASEAELRRGVEERILKERIGVVMDFRVLSRKYRLYGMSREEFYAAAHIMEEVNASYEE